MTTIHEIQPDRVATAASTRLRRRQHLDHLLDVRTRLAESAAFYRAHGLDSDAEDVSMQQYVVEATIGEQFPDVYVQEWPMWVSRDAELAHDAMSLSPTCPICRAIAKRGGVNLTRPEAA
jgi:hypothetical protein